MKEEGVSMSKEEEKKRKRRKEKEEGVYCTYIMYIESEYRGISMFILRCSPPMWAQGGKV